VCAAADLIVILQCFAVRVRNRGAATFSEASISMVVKVTGTSGERSRAMRRSVSTSAFGSPTVRVTTLKLVLLYTCWRYGM